MSRMSLLGELKRRKVFRVAAGYILTAWVLMAEHRSLPYRLVLPELTVPAGSGPAHRAACLEALALFPS